MQYYELKQNIESQMHVKSIAEALTDSAKYVQHYQILSERQIHVQSIDYETPTDGAK